MSSSPQTPPPVPGQDSDRDAGPAAVSADGAAPAAVSWSEALRFWLKLGFISFGGPAGQIAIMHTELVERRRWISDKRFLHALNYCMLLPGPEAQQLATYLGWLMHRSAGGIAAGVLFVLPSLLILIALSAAYMAYGDQPLVAGLLYGIKPAVCAIVLHAAWRVGSRVLRHPLLWGIAAGAFVALAILQLPFVLIVLAAALAGWLGGRRWPTVFGGSGGHGGAQAPAKNAAQPAAWIDDDTPTPAHARFSRARLLRVLAIGLVLWALPLLLLRAWGEAVLGSPGMLAQMGGFFTQAALLTFGGAYAVLPFVYQGVVVQHGWLTGPQMITGLALGETTPGPLIMVVAFVGFVAAWQSPQMALLLGRDARLLAGIVAACVATWFTFLPSFLFILAGGPLVESTRGQLGFSAPLTGITAAVVGVILSLALFFGTHVLWPQGLQGPFDVAAALLAAAAALALLRWKRGVIEVIAACALAGLLWRTLGP